MSLCNCIFESPPNILVDDNLMTCEDFFKLQNENPRDPNQKYKLVTPVLRDNGPDWTFSKFEVGNFLKIPSDDERTYTSLLFPPNNFELKGGDLIFTEYSKTTTIKPETFTKYTQVTFSKNAFYEVMPVESSAMLVFERPLFSEQYENDISPNIHCKNLQNGHNDGNDDNGNLQNGVCDDNNVNDKDNDFKNNDDGDGDDCYDNDNNADKDNDGGDDDDCDDDCDGDGGNDDGDGDDNDNDDVEDDNNHKTISRENNNFDKPIIARDYPGYNLSPQYEFTGTFIKNHECFDENDVHTIIIDSPQQI